MRDFEDIKIFAFLPDLLCLRKSSPLFSAGRDVSLGGWVYPGHPRTSVLSSLSFVCGEARRRGGDSKRC